MFLCQLHKKLKLFTNHHPGRPGPDSLVLCWVSPGCWFSDVEWSGMCVDDCGPVEISLRSETPVSRTPSDDPRLSRARTHPGWETWRRPLGCRHLLGCSGRRAARDETVRLCHVCQGNSRAPRALAGSARAGFEGGHWGTCSSASARWATCSRRPNGTRAERCPLQGAQHNPTGRSGNPPRALSWSAALNGKWSHWLWANSTDVICSHGAGGFYLTAACRWSVELDCFSFCRSARGSSLWPHDRCWPPDMEGFPRTANSAKKKNYLNLMMM